MSTIQTRMLRGGVACVLLGFITTGAMAASSAEAGPYEAIQCAPDLGAGHGAFHFSRTSADFRGDTACGSGDGLGVTHEQRRTHAGRYGMWVAGAPDGTYFTGGKLVARGKRDGGFVPRLLLGVSAQGTLAPFGSPHGNFQAFDWGADGGADRVVAELTCDRQGEACARTDAPKIYLKRARFHLFDVAAPSVTGVGGALLTAPVQRGTQGLVVDTQDVGAGVRRVSVRANGRPVDSAGPECAIAGARQLALRLSPCPSSASTTFGINTQLPAFHEGENTITACVDDYASQDPNERCAQRRIRVQNDCPISDVTSPIWAHFAFVDGGSAKRIRFGRHPGVVARLADSTGAAGAGALVCISERLGLPDSTESLIGPPLRTDERGRVSVRLPAGPSRTVYLTYWRGPEQVVTRALRLRVTPKVSLRVRPRRRLHNGQTMKLRARLRGPLRAHRKLKILARPPGGRWVPFSTHFVKRTNADGVVHASHTFRHVVGTERFRFRVRVPRQAGYPYLRGRSGVRRVTVAGG